MRTATQISIGAVITIGAFAAYYHTSSRRRIIPVDPASLETKRLNHIRSGSPSPETERHELVRNQAEANDNSQWQKFTDKIAAAKASIVASAPTLNVTSVLPDWSIGLPDWITRLQRELNMEPGSLADTIWKEARDPNVNPEVTWDATVRIGADLCNDEKQFLRARRDYTRIALARYLDIPEDEVHEDDVPVIAATGSGGGLRAMVASAGYYQSLKEAGLFDCTTYMAGVSGSCWLQSVYLTSYGGQSFAQVIDHLKSRIGIHIAHPPTALELLDTSPTNKYLLRGVVEKLKLGSTSFGLVDMYGLLLGARLLVPNDAKVPGDEDQKLSRQRRFIDGGEQPMPIYTAVRHEIPGIGAENETNKTVDPEEKKEAINQTAEENDSYFQWFEVTPYEVYSEDLEAGIPTWGLGRKYENGRNVDREIPELKLPLLFGIFGSAFCATLSHYYAEIRPFVTSISMLAKLDAMVLQRTDSLAKVHPIDPATVPNFVKGLKDKLPETCPTSLHESETIQLMDAGMSNNLACYPLMRKGRNVDIVIAFDSSADIQTANWIGYTEGYAKQRKVVGWPVSMGWPPANEEKAVEQLDQAQAESTAEAQEKLEEAQAAETAADLKRKSKTLGPLTVWVGSKEARDTQDEPPKSAAEEDDDWHLMHPHAGIVVAYLPLIANPKVPDIDPDVTPYLSTWNFEWTPEQIDATIALARANFEEGAERLKRTVRAVYERKKRLRLEREERERIEDEKSWDVVGGHHRHHDHFS